MTCRIFARLVGVQSGRTVRRWERGDRDIPGTVEMLLEALPQRAGAMTFEAIRHRIDTTNRAQFTLETAEKQVAAQHILEWNHAIEELTRIITETLEKQP